MKAYVKPTYKKVHLNISKSIAERCWSQIHSEGASGVYAKDPNGTHHGWIAFSITSCDNTTRTVHWIPGYIEGTKDWNWGGAIDVSDGRSITEADGYVNVYGNPDQINPLQIVNNLLSEQGSDEHSWKGGDINIIFDGVKDS